MASVSMKLPPVTTVEFRFHKDQKYCITPVSKFLGIQVSEKTKTPIYYQYKRVHFDNKWYIGLYYSVFYEANPGYLGGFAGYHDADVERFVILFNEKSLHPEWVYFGAHGNGMGCWRRWSECQKTPDGLLCVYVSSSSHAFYPSPGIWVRGFGVLNDETGDHRRWRPIMADFHDARKQTWSQTHPQVQKGINSPLNVSDPTRNSITLGQRFFLALPNVKEKLKNEEKVQVDTILF